MKKHPLITGLLAALLILNTGFAAEAQNYELSLALELISEEIQLRKCTVPHDDIRFTSADFENALGKTVEYITVTSLPDPAVGTLKYAGGDVYENQSFARKNLELLRFVPGTGTGSTAFCFSVDGDMQRTSVCTLDVLDSVNTMPHTRDSQYRAMSGIGLVRSFEVMEPDGDEYEIKVLEYPQNGILREDNGVFTYTSASSFDGKDSFSWQAVDRYGNASAKSVVNISVSKPQSDVRYNDMAGHWGYTGAMAMTELGLMGGAEKDGKYMFCPDMAVSRGDFLAMAMISAGLEEKVTLGAVTTFADDDKIPSNIKSYASYAMSTGIVSGYVTDNGSAVFGSSDGITRAEAASVLANILDEAPGIYEFDFADAASIPGWAKDSFASLVSMGIINGDTNGALEPQRLLTRAEAAQLLCNTVEYLENKHKEAQEQKGFFEKFLGIFR